MVVPGVTTVVVEPVGVLPEPPVLPVVPAPPEPVVGRTEGGVAVGLAVGVVAGVAVGVAETVGVAVAVGAAGTTTVSMATLHDTVLPPGLPEPLHWCTCSGIAPLMLELVATVQLTLAPPPFPDPLHWVTVAPVVFAGNGAQVRTPLPLADPTHWLTVAVDKGSAPGVSPLMVLWTVTVQVIVWAASLSEPLHCWMSVMRSVEVLVNVPLPGAHGPRLHCRVTVSVELVTPLLMVFQTSTVQVMPVVAPLASGPTPLHWSTEPVAAQADVGDRLSVAAARKVTATARNAVASTRAKGRMGMRAPVLEERGQQL